MKSLQIIERPDLEQYQKTLRVQQQLVDAKANDRLLPDMLLFVEHDHIYTIGRGAKKQIISTPDKKNIRWVESLVEVMQHTMALDN
jgi:lipoate-protein ligase B